MSHRVPTDPKLLESAARVGGVELTTERLAQLAPAMDGFYAMLDALHECDLGETPPAFAFRAKWADR